MNTYNHDKKYLPPDYLFTDHSTQEEHPDFVVVDSSSEKQYLDSAYWNHKEMSEFFQIKSHHKILDIGCAYGRLAIPFIHNLTSGSYLGIDIQPETIDWNNEVFKEHKNFNFKYINLFSNYFNPNGEVVENERLYSLLDGEKFDLIIFHSIFTHLLKPAVLQFLDLISDNLNDCNYSGSWVTIYLFSEKDRLSGILENASIKFVDNGEVIITRLPDQPEEAVAIQIEWFNNELKKRNLHIASAKYGSWIKSPENNGLPQGQDIVFIKKGIR